MLAPLIVLVTGSAVLADVSGVAATPVIPPLIAAVVTPPPATPGVTAGAGTVGRLWSYGKVPRWTGRPSGRVVSGVLALTARALTVTVSGVTADPPRVAPQDLAEMGPFPLQVMATGIIQHQIHGTAQVSRQHHIQGTAHIGAPRSVDPEEALALQLLGWTERS